jgi:hypothetical protein
MTVATIDPLALLNTARVLAPPRKGSGRPRRTDLRRATSTAYYALFHQLIHDGAAIAFPGTTPEDIGNVTRWFTHDGVARSCQWLTKADLPPSRPPKKTDRPAVDLRRNANGTVPSSVVDIAQSFLDLQGRRQEADYSDTFSPTRFETLSDISSAERAITDARRFTSELQRGQASPEALTYSRLVTLALITSGGPKPR